MDLSNKHIGKYKYLIYGLTILIGVSIPMTLGAIGEDLEQYEAHYKTSVESLKVQVQEACKWKQAILLEKNKTLTKADDIVKNADELKKVQLDCLSYIQEQVF